MSKRRNIGDRVWVRPLAGFGVSRGEWATIIDWPSNQPEERFSCCLDCSDPACEEWNDLETDDGRPLYHIAECEMFDEPSKKAEAPE